MQLSIQDTQRSTLHEGLFNATPEMKTLSQPGTVQFSQKCLRVSPEEGGPQSMYMHIILIITRTSGFLERLSLTVTSLLTGVERGFNKPFWPPWMKSLCGIDSVACEYWVCKWMKSKTKNNYPCIYTCAWHLKVYRPKILELRER